MTLLQGRAVIQLDLLQLGKTRLGISNALTHPCLMRFKWVFFSPIKIILKQTNNNNNKKKNLLSSPYMIELRNLEPRKKNTDPILKTRRAACNITMIERQNKNESKPHFKRSQLKHQAVLTGQLWNRMALKTGQMKALFPLMNASRNLFLLLQFKTGP